MLFKKLVAQKQLDIHSQYLKRFGQDCYLKLQEIAKKFNNFEGIMNEPMEIFLPKVHTLINIYELVAYQIYDSCAASGFDSFGNSILKIVLHMQSIIKWVLVNNTKQKKRRKLSKTMSSNLNTIEPIANDQEDPENKLINFRERQITIFKMKTQIDNINQEIRKQQKQISNNANHQNYKESKKQAMDTNSSDARILLSQSVNYFDKKNQFLKKFIQARENYLNESSSLENKSILKEVINMSHYDKINEVIKEKVRSACCKFISDIDDLRRSNMRQVAVQVKIEEIQVQKSPKKKTHLKEIKILKSQIEKEHERNIKLQQQIASLKTQYRRVSRQSQMYQSSSLFQKCRGQQLLKENQQIKKKLECSDRMCSESQDVSENLQRDSLMDQGFTFENIRLRNHSNKTMLPLKRIMTKRSSSNNQMNKLHRISSGLFFQNQIGEIRQQYQAQGFQTPLFGETRKKIQSDLSEQTQQNIQTKYIFDKNVCNLQLFPEKVKASQCQIFKNTVNLFINQESKENQKKGIIKYKIHARPRQIPVANNHNSNINSFKILQFEETDNGLVFKSLNKLFQQIFDQPDNNRQNKRKQTSPSEQRVSEEKENNDPKLSIVRFQQHQFQTPKSLRQSQEKRTQTFRQKILDWNKAKKQIESHRDFYQDETKLLDIQSLPKSANHMKIQKNIRKFDSQKYLQEAQNICSLSQNKKISNEQINFFDIAFQLSENFERLKNCPQYIVNEFFSNLFLIDSIFLGQNNARNIQMMSLSDSCLKQRSRATSNTNMRKIRRKNAYKSHESIINLQNNLISISNSKINDRQCPKPQQQRGQDIKAAQFILFNLQILKKLHKNCSKQKKQLKSKYSKLIREYLLFLKFPYSYVHRRDDKNWKQETLKVDYQQLQLKKAELSKFMSRVFGLHVACKKQYQFHHDNIGQIVVCQHLLILFGLFGIRPLDKTI